MRIRHLAAAALALGLGLACNTGEGSGDVLSDRLFIAECWDGAFDLQPNFFAANPFQEEEVLFRIQKGDDFQEFSDGMTILVKDIQDIRGGRLGEALDVGLPVGVTPPGVPVTPGAAPPVSMALYLHQTCTASTGTLYSVGGTITFTSLFSGDPNEEVAEDRLTEATFDVIMADPRDLQGDGMPDADATSRVTGSFRFFFQRGQPAQPFP